jgi:multidrug efflux pump subunit AcrB
MFSRFFIDRPIFASVLSIVVTLGGYLSMQALPVAQYPEITPPTIEVSATYPGANAEVVADTVAAPIEQQVNGVEKMMYMSSQCTNDGTYTLTITFNIGVDLDMAQVLVQNREALAEPLLPELVKRRGVSVKKKSPSTLMIVNLFSPDESRNNLYLSNYATTQLRDELLRLEGVGDISYLGRRDFSMRVWLDPEKMAHRNLTSADVVAAISQQNIQVAAGQIGQPPVPTGQVFQYTMSTLGRLATAEQFEDMILRADDRGRIIRLKDVGTVKLGAQNYDQVCTLDGKPSVALSVYQRPGSNALRTAEAVKEKMADLAGRFPDGLAYRIVYDTTPFIEESVHEVFITLRDAVALVALVVLLFLQNWRSAIIPLVAVPVAIIGTFAVMAAIGFSLNNLTLFGLVLAIGIVVDDAIVVVEAVEHHIEEGMQPRDATIRAMQEVSGPVIAIGLVLSAVFIPCAFVAGIVGQFYKQFALTIATSTIISAFNSLTLSPALCALLLKPRDPSRRHGPQVDPLPRIVFAALGGWLGSIYLAPQLAGRWTTHGWQTQAVAILGGALLGWVLGRPVNRVIGMFFRAFNHAFNRATGWYVGLVGGILRISFIVLLLYGGLLALTYIGFTRTPTGFIPLQDKGYLLVNLQLRDGSSLQQSQEALERAEKMARGVPGVAHTVAIAGQSLLLNANAPNFASMYVMLDEFQHRKAKSLSGESIAARLQEQLQEEIIEASVRVFPAAPVEGLGTAGGFKVVIEDRNGAGSEELQQVAEAIVAEGNEGTEVAGLKGLFTSYRANTPWIDLVINRTMAMSMGLSMSQVFSTLQVYLGSLYVNDFNRFSRTWQVNVQGSPEYRQRIEDLKQYKIKGDSGRMVPLASICRPEQRPGPIMISRYNMYPSAGINGSAAAGVSSGQAIERMGQVVQDQLTPAMRSEWTELALLQLQTGNTAMLVFALAVVLVFLVLAAQYESWSLPMAVILVVPMCLLCSIFGVNAARLDINVFTQVGFIVLVGLACKNAILIVEFAKARREVGIPRREATLQACRLRLRPIVMTSLAFILGVVPLVLAEGAGAEMRRTLGTAVFAGMVGVTLFGIFLTPVFYSVIQWISDARMARLAKASGGMLELASSPRTPSHLEAVGASH